MKELSLLSIQNEQAISIEDIPFITMSKFQDIVIKETIKGKRILSFFGIPKSSNEILLYLCLADDANKKIFILSTSAGKSYPSLTAKCIQAHLFEREIAEQLCVFPEKHPNLKPLRFHTDSAINDVFKKNLHKDEKIFNSSFFQFYSSEVHEVAVGPVHAGIIEPGHFRFQCHGEKILNLEIALGYQLRGLEKALLGGPNKKTIHYMQTAAGDTTIGHTTAYCQIIESLSSCKVPQRALYLRAIALELERLANHTGDLGALANDVGFLPTSSFCGRLRGDFLNLSALLCGSRFGREMLRPGGVNFDCNATLINELSTKLKKALQSTLEAADLLFHSPSVMNRFEKTGVITSSLCKELGIIGVAARASGIKKDIRCDFPFGIYSQIPIGISTYPNGDVYSRAMVRYLEIQKSAMFIQKLLSTIPSTPIANNIEQPLKSNSFVISLVEGFRGEICHIAMTDDKGLFSLYKIIDPSFHNWIGLELAVRQEEIYNFPLCNKSFNLSYCGHDL